MIDLKAREVLFIGECGKQGCNSTSLILKDRTLSRKEHDPYSLKYKEVGYCMACRQTTTREGDVIINSPLGRTAELSLPMHTAMVGREIALMERLQDKLGAEEDEAVADIVLAGFEERHGGRPEYPFIVARELILSAMYHSCGRENLSIQVITPDEGLSVEEIHALVMRGRKESLEIHIIANVSTLRDRELAERHGKTAITGALRNSRNRLKFKVRYDIKLTAAYRENEARELKAKLEEKRKAEEAERAYQEEQARIAAAIEAERREKEFLDRLAAKSAEMYVPET